MKKSILILAAAFTFSAFFTSCRESNERTEVEVNEDLDNIEENLEEAAEDVENEVEEAANEVEQEVRTDDY